MMLGIARMAMVVMVTMIPPRMRPKMATALCVVMSQTITQNSGVVDP